jgi:hypothetical protein
LEFCTFKITTHIVFNTSGTLKLLCVKWHTWTGGIVGWYGGYLAKAVIGCLFSPSHKWDGNENKKFIAVGFNQRLKKATN